MKIAMGIVLMAISTAASAWTQPVYRCGNSYSDEPCANGKPVDILPTEGAHSMSGNKRLSTEVEMRKNRRALYEALKPVTGVSANEMERRTAERQYEQKGRIEIHRSTERPQGK